METDRLAALEAKVDAMMLLLKERMPARPPAPNFKIKEFAEIVGKSRWTIMKHIREGTLLKVNGRIPRDQLKKYCS